MGCQVTSWVTEFRDIRAHNKAESKLSRNLRDRALKNIDAICKNAALRAGIGLHDLTKAQVLKLQKDLFHDASLAKAGAAGFAVIYKGEDGINTALRCIQDKSTGTRAGHCTNFGHFARWLERMSHDDRYEPIRAAYRQYVFRNYPIGEGEVVLGGVCPKRHLHSFATIINEFQMEPHRLKSFLGGFGFASGKLTGKPTAEELGYFPAEESEARIREVTDVIGRIEATKFLNVNRPLFDRLRKIGVVQPVATFDGLKGLYKPSHLDEVLSWFNDRAEFIDKFSGSRMDLGVACNKAKVTVVSILWVDCLKWRGVAEPIALCRFRSI